MPVTDPLAAPGPVLAEGYYADNFAVLIATVEERYGDLLAPGEAAYAHGWRALSLPARRLYVRLVSRRGPCLRRDRLDYREIPDLDAALAELEDAGFADAAPEEEPAGLLPLLLKDELRGLGERLLEPGAWPSRTARKADWLEALAAGAAPADLRRAFDETVRVVRPLGHEHLLVFRLLFFGNLRQDLTDFVLRDLGMVRYEAYDLAAELRLFPTRAALEETLEWLAERSEISRLIAEDELPRAAARGRTLLERVRLEGAPRHPAARRAFEGVCRALGRALERAGELEEARALYAAAHRPPARERHARVLEYLGRVDEALELAREIAASPRDETEAAFAPRFLHRLRRRRGEVSGARPRRRRPTLDLDLERPPQGAAPMAVEDLVLEHLAARGQKGVFAENWLWKALFGLAFWDVVFAPVPGVFQHPFQAGPLDFHGADFRHARADLVVERLERLCSTEDLAAWIWPMYEAKRDIANPLVPWAPELRPALELALERLRGEHLAVVCDRLSRDPSRFRRGLPDLFVHADEAPGFLLYEVKAPGDQLRPEQGAWIDYLNAHGLPARVVRVRYRD